MDMTAIGPIETIMVKFKNCDESDDPYGQSYFDVLEGSDVTLKALIANVDGQDDAYGRTIEGNIASPWGLAYALERLGYEVLPSSADLVDMADADREENVRLIDDDILVLY